MPETVRDLILKVTVESPNTAKFDKDAKKSAASIDKITDSATKSSKSVAEIAKEMEETRKNIQDNALKVSDSFKTAGEGAFTMARGIALSAISSEEDLKKVIETVAKIQGAFDIFKGSLDVFRGFTEGMRALKTASTAATSAQAALASANSAVAVTGAAATASMGTLLVTLGPIAVALAAAVAVYALLNRKKEETIDNTEKEAKANEKLERQLRNVDDAYALIGNAVTDLTRFRIKEGLAGGAAGALADIAEDASEAKDQIFRLAKADVNVSRLTRAFGDAADAVDYLHRTLEFPPESFLSSTVIPDDAVLKVFEKRMREAEFAANLLKADREAGQDTTAVLRQQISLIEKAAELKIAGETKALDLAKQQLDLAEQRNRSFTRSFALRDKAEQQVIRNIAKRVKAGGVESLSIGQFLKVEQFLKKEDVLKFEQAEGRKSDAAGLAASLGRRDLKEGVQAARAERKRIEDKISRIRADTATKTAEVKEALTETLLEMEQILLLLRDFNLFINDFTTLIDRARAP